MKPLKVREYADEIITQEVLTEAIHKGRKRSQCILHATSVRFLGDLNAVAIGFSDRAAILLPVDNYTELRDLTPDELDGIELGFAGSALCLEHRNMHVSIAGLILGSEPLMAMAASVIATRNGRRSSKAKANASKANGMKGGRPRKAIASTES